jgi:hypothetical protein
MDDSPEQNGERDTQHAFALRIYLMKDAVRKMLGE